MQKQNKDPQVRATVQMLYIAKTDGFKAVSELQLDANGILESKHYNTSLERSVLLSSTSSYELASKHGITMEYGDLGENILLDYNELYQLTPKEQFQIGDVIFEITQHCSLCKGLSGVNTKLPKLLKNDRGIFAKVIKEGTLKMNDSFFLIN